MRKIFSCALVFTALTLLFTLVALADITGGEGKLLGLDEGKDYLAASVTMNTSGDGASIGAYSAVTSSTNGLAGLYYVKEDGADGNGTLVYVYGSAADRNALFKTPISKYGDLYVKTNDRTPGMFGYNGQHWEWASSWGSTRIIARITSSLTHFSTSNGGDKNTTTDGQRKEQWNTVIAANAANIKYTYTFTSDEIIPINEVESYTYGIAARWNNFKYANHVVKFVANVIGKDGTLTSYEYLHTPADFTVSASGKEGTLDFRANASTKKIVDFTKKTSSSGEWKALPSEGYLVGFEVYPIYNMTDWSKVTIGGTVNNHPVLSLLVINDPANYVISLPESPAPSGISSENGAITGLQSGVNYEFAPVNLVGEGALGLANGVVYDDLDSTANKDLAGLYYVRVKATSEASASAPALVYVEGDALNRQDIGTIVSSKPQANIGTEFAKESFIMTGFLYSSALTKVDGNYYQFGSYINQSVDDREKMNGYLNDYRTKYSYASNEIIHASELQSFKIGFRNHYTSFNKIYVKPKVVFHVLSLDDGSITPYTWSAAASEAVSIESWSSNFTVDAATTLNGVDGYVVGFEIFPWDNIDTTAWVKNRTADFVFASRISNYSIVLPKAEAPVGVYDNGGKIGLPDARVYEFAPVNLIGAGVLGLADGVSYADLDSTANKDLAGLYYVRVKATSEASASAPALVYVEGDISGRLILGDTVTDGSGNVDPVAVAGTSFIPETFVLPKTNASILNANGTRPYRMGANISRHLTDGVIDKTAFKTELDNYVIRYSYASNEIVKANEFEQIKIGFGYVNYSYYNNLKVQPKVVFYVANDEGTIRAVTWIADEAKDLKKLTDASGNDTQFEIKVSKALSSVSDYYVVGFEIYPWSDVDLTEVSVAKTGDFYFATVIHRDASFKITLPKVEAPVGLSVNGYKVTGLNKNLSYTATPVTYIGEIGSVVDIPAGNTEYTLTAGLYNIRVNGSEGFADSDPVLVYIKGTATARRAIFKDITTTADLYVRGELAKGKFTLSGASWERDNSWGSPRTALRVTSALTHFSTANGGDKNTTTDDDRKAQFESVVAPLAPEVKYTYVLEEDEIVPISEVESYTYGVAARWNNFTYKDLVVKFVAHVMDEDGKITSYEYLHTAKDFNSSAAGKEATYNYMNNATAKKTVDFTQKTSDFGAWTTELPDDGYFVGFDVYPIYNMTDWSKVTVGGSVNNHPVLSLFIVNEAENYEIYVPKMPTPTGLTVKEEMVSGFEAGKTYVAVPFTVIGRNDDGKFVITPNSEGKYTFDAEVSAGLWGVCIEGDDYFDDSEPSQLIYIKGSSEKRAEIGVISGTNTLADYDGSKTGYVIGKFSGGVSNAGDTVVGAYRYLAQSIVSSSLAQELWLHQNTKASAQAALDDVKKADAPGIEMQAAIDAFYTTEYESMSALEKAAAKLECQERIKAELLNGATIWYGYTSDEIIPVDELYTVTIGFNKHIGSLRVNEVQARVTLAVMDDSGVVTEYSTLTSSYNYQNNNQVRTLSVDVASIEGLPSKGYVVGIKVDHFAELEAKDITSEPNSLVQSNLSNRFHTSMQSFLFYTNNASYVIKHDASAPELYAFPAIDGKKGNISGFDPEYLYEYKYSADGAGWSDEWTSVPAGVTSFDVSAVGDYMIRIKDSENYGRSSSVTVRVIEYSGNPDELPYTEPIAKIHLPNDFVELKAEYEIDVTIKNWVSSIALQNLKTVSPASTLVIKGDGYAFKVVCENIEVNNAVHYYDMKVSFNGESRFNAAAEILKELAGDRYVTDIYYESTSGLPFTKGELEVELGDEYAGYELELHLYNERIEKLRKTETVFVLDGVVTFNNIGSTAVILKAE